MQELKSLVGQYFHKTKARTFVPFILEEVRTKKVLLREEGRKDSILVNIPEFQKHYSLV